MFKTVSVSIGKTPFIIEEQAYAKLDEYLQAIRAHFASTADADEIVSDIESRMAEELIAALGKSRKIVESKDIDAVIATMGTVEDFRKFDEGQSKQESHESPFKKVRLYRDADDQILGGVSAGIANYFGIDPIIVRLAFGLSVFLGGFGVVLYIVLWVALPEARTTAEKVEMTGGRVTLSTLQKRIDEVVPPDKRKSAFRKIVGFPFHIIRTVLRFVGKVLKIVIPFIGRVVGVILCIGASFVIAGLTFSLFVMALNPNSPYIGLPLHEAMSTYAYLTLLLSGYFVAFAPVVLILLIGASLVLMRYVFSSATVVALTVLWFAAGTAGATTLFNTMPQLEPAFAKYDEKTEQTFELDGFTSVTGSDVQRIIVTEGPEFSVTLEGSERAQATYEPIVEDGVLSLQTMPDHDRCMIFCLSRRATLRVTMPSLDSITADDMSHLTLMGFSGSNLTITTQDVSYVDAESAFGDLTVQSADNSTVELRGSADTVTATLDGISRLRGADFVVQDANLTLVDNSKVTLDVRQSLKGSVGDFSRIEYITTPPTVEVDEQDMGSVRQRDGEEW